MELSLKLLEALIVITPTIGLVFVIIYERHLRRRIIRALLGCLKKG